MKPTTYLIHYIRRAKRDGKFPVKIRVVYNREHKDFKTGIDLNLEEYKNATEVKPKKEFRDLGIKLNELQNRANKIIDNIGVFTFQKFEDAFYMRFKDSADIFPFFEEYINSLEKEGRLKTASSYSCAMRSIKSFQNRIGFYDITADFLKKYHAWMTLTEKNSETTVGIYTRSLRSIYNNAISQGVIKKDENYPFGKRKFVIPAGNNIKKALTIDEVGKIYIYETIPGSPEDKAKDFWILSYFCNGINFKDVSLLKNKNLDGDMLRFVREKTRNSTQGNQTKISCHISEPLKQIIEKWRNVNKAPAEYLFDILDPKDTLLQQMNKVSQFIKNVNKYMKRISEAVGIEMKVTTYFARHSAATIMKKSGASIEEVSEALGHASTSQTRKYLNSFDDESKKGLSNSLTQFIKK